jgi:hypothetical protein
LGYADISGTYASVGNPLMDAALWGYFLNTTDVNIIFSIGGVFDGFLLPPQAYLVIDAQTNRSETTTEKEFAKNAQWFVYAPSGNPTLGSVYISMGV